MRIGILGGTFNPIHFGHIYPTCEAAEKLKLDRVLFIPAYSPPHKPDGEIISAYHRKNMIKEAIKEYPSFELSSLETDRKGISYSVDTVTSLMENEKGNVFFIIGVDAFLEINVWKDANRLLQSCNFAVIPRDDINFSGLFKTISKNLSEKFRDFKFYTGEAEPESGLKCIKTDSSSSIIVPLDITPVNISSTGIRKKIRNGVSIRKFVPEKVNIYIEKNKLYI